MKTSKKGAISKKLVLAINFGQPPSLPAENSTKPRNHVATGDN